MCNWILLSTCCVCIFDWSDFLSNRGGLALGYLLYKTRRQRKNTYNITHSRKKCVDVESLWLLKDRELELHIYMYMYI